VDEKRNYYQLIPKKELKCVWMTAGLLSYKLCKYDLQCEKCPLDWELRNLSATPSVDLAAYREWKGTDSEGTRPTPAWKKEISGGDLLTEDLSRPNIHGSLFYHPGHTWVKVEKADEVRVGLDCFLGKIIEGVKVIVLPLSGRKFSQGESLCSLIQEEGILDIVFPVSGLILSVNQELKDQPELITKEPLGEGFLLTLKPKNLQRDQKHLFFGEAALAWYQKEWERFKTAVISELHHGQDSYRSAPIRGKMLKAAVISELHHDRGSVGMTMQDGEINLGDIKKSIGPQRFFQLVNAFLREGERDSHPAKYRRGDSSKFQPG